MEITVVPRAVPPSSVRRSASRPENDTSIASLPRSPIKSPRMMIRSSVAPSEKLTVAFSLMRSAESVMSALSLPRKTAVAVLSMESSSQLRAPSMLRRRSVSRALMSLTMRIRSLPALSPASSSVIPLRLPPFQMNWSSPPPSRMRPLMRPPSIRTAASPSLFQIAVPLPASISPPRMVISARLRPAPLLTRTAPPPASDVPVTVPVTSILIRASPASASTPKPLPPSTLPVTTSLIVPLSCLFLRQNSVNLAGNETRSGDVDMHGGGVAVCVLRVDPRISPQWPIPTRGCGSARCRC